MKTVRKLPIELLPDRRELNVKNTFSQTERWAYEERTVTRVAKSSVFSMTPDELDSLNDLTVSLGLAHLQKSRAQEEKLAGRRIFQNRLSDFTVKPFVQRSEHRLRGLETINTRVSGRADQEDFIKIESCHWHPGTQQASSDGRSTKPSDFREERNATLPDVTVTPFV